KRSGAAQPRVRPASREVRRRRRVDRRTLPYTRRRSQLGRRVTRDALLETSVRPGREALPTAPPVGSQASTRRASPPTEDPRPVLRRQRLRAEFSNDASAPARARRGMPPREPTTAQDLRQDAFP